MTENVAGTEPLYRVVSRRRVDGVEARGMPLPRDAAQAPIPVFDGSAPADAFQKVLDACSHEIAMAVLGKTAERAIVAVDPAGGPDETAVAWFTRDAAGRLRPLIPDDGRWVLYTPDGPRAEPPKPEPAAGQVWACPGTCPTPQVIDRIAPGTGGLAGYDLAHLRSADGSSYRYGALPVENLSKDTRWRCVGVESPMGRVMVGERRRVVDHGHPSDGQPVRVHSIIDDCFVALDFGDGDGLPLAHSAARVASWPLVDAPEPLAEWRCPAACTPKAPGVHADAYWYGGKPTAPGPAVGTRAWYVNAAVNLLHLVTPGGLTAADVDIGGETGYLDVLVPWRVTENYRASAEDVLREAAPVGPLVLRIVRVDPYAAGRAREEAALAARETMARAVAHGYRPGGVAVPQPSARTVALRSLVGEQTLAEAYAPEAPYVAGVKPVRALRWEDRPAEAREGWATFMHEPRIAPTAAAMLDAQRRAERRSGHVSS